MARLSSIISSVLRDFLVAQHRANLYSLSLSRYYESAGKAKDFPLPAIAVGEIEMTLHYGIKSADIQLNEKELNYAEIKDFFDSVSLPLARVIISGSLAALDVENQTEEQIIRHLQTVQNMRNKFTRYLAQQIASGLKENTDRLVYPEGNINQEALLEQLMDIGEERFLSHPELISLFKGALKRKASEGMHSALDGILLKLLGESNFSAEQLYPSLDITVDYQELIKLPPDSIQTLRFKIAPSHPVIDEPQQ